MSPETAGADPVRALAVLIHAMDYLCDSRGIDSGHSLYADAEALASRKLLGKLASDARVEVKKIP
jgi:hypothetical protein